MMEERSGPPLVATFELFLSPAEKDTFAEWHGKEDENSPWSWALAPALDWLTAGVPDDLAPTLLSLAGTLAMVQAWQFSAAYAETAPTAAWCVTAVALATFWTSSEVSRRHGSRTMNDTPLGELFGHFCCLSASVLLAAALCPLLEMARSDAQWHCVQAVQLGYLWVHHSAFVRGATLPRAFLCELAMGIAGLLLLLHGVAVSGLLRGFALHPKDNSQQQATVPQMLLVTVFSAVILHVMLSSGKHQKTRNVLLLTLALRGLNGLLRAALMHAPVSGGQLDAVCDGFFLAAISSDLMLARMVGRELHPGMAVAAAAVVVPNQHVITLGFVAFYYVSVFLGLSSYLNMPLFGIIRNVYCDGIYDLCHIGHKNVFRRASTLGNQLFVGVVGDQDATQYKRPPAMSAAEREAEVASCKGVTKVIRNAPCFGLTEEFLRKHRIHVVAYGQEYMDRFPDPDDDPYYRVPRKLGIACPLPRTECYSTTELVQRIRSIEAADLHKKSPT